MLHTAAALQLCAGSTALQALAAAAALSADLTSEQPHLTTSVAALSADCAALTQLLASHSDTPRWAAPRQPRAPSTPLRRALAATAAARTLPRFAAALAACPPTIVVPLHALSAPPLPSQTAASSPPTYAAAAAAHSRDATEHQAQRDVERDVVCVNGRRCVGSAMGFAAVVAAVMAAVARVEELSFGGGGGRGGVEGADETRDRTAADARAVAVELLKAGNRTVSGGDGYDAACQLLTPSRSSGLAAWVRQRQQQRPALGGGTADDGTDGGPHTGDGGAAITPDSIDWPPSDASPLVLLIADPKASPPISIEIDVGPYQLPPQPQPQPPLTSMGKLFSGQSPRPSGSPAGCVGDGDYHVNGGRADAVDGRSGGRDGGRLGGFSPSLASAQRAADAPPPPSSSITTTLVRLGLSQELLDGTVEEGARWRVGVRAVITATTLFRIVDPLNPDVSAPLAAPRRSISGSGDDSDSSDVLSGVGSGRTSTAAGTTTTTQGAVGGSYDHGGVEVGGQYGRVRATYVRRVAWQPTFLASPSPPTTTTSTAATRSRLPSLAGVGQADGSVGGSAAAALIWGHIDDRVLPPLPPLPPHGRSGEEQPPSTGNFTGEAGRGTVSTASLLLAAMANEMAGGDFAGGGAFDAHASSEHLGSPPQLPGVAPTPRMCACGDGGSVVIGIELPVSAL